MENNQIYINKFYNLLFFIKHVLSNDQTRFTRLFLFCFFKKYILYWNFMHSKNYD